MQSEVNWFDLVEKFLDSVAIKNGRDDVDLTLFAMYVRSNECPLFGDLATLERSIYSVSNCYMDFTGIDQKFEIANDLDLLPWVEVVMTTYRAATLLSPEPASTLTRSPDTLYTLIYKSKLDNDVRLRPITPDLGKLLSQSRRLQGELLTANNLIMNEVRHLWAEGCFQASKFGGDGQ